jgi:hypothetical protein
VVLAFVGAHGLVVLYALVQAYGFDPFTWGAGILYVGPVFSTLGNPNFSAGYVGLTLPLLVWAAFGSRLGVVLRMVAGAGVGVSSVALAYLNSFQGDVAGLAAIAVLGQWAWQRGRRERSVAVGTALPVVAVIAGVPLMLDAPGKGLLLGLAAVLGICSGLGAWLDERESEVVPDDLSGEDSGVGQASQFWRRHWVRLVSVLVTVTVGGVLVGGRVLDQLESGLEQRFAFWRTSLSIFASNPLVGTGLETYSAHFTAHRPLSHAIQYEYVLSDSPHSVPLGLLSGGGLLLAVAYAGLMMVILWAGVRAARRSGGSERLMYGAVLSSWIAYQVQSSVSMDVPGLLYTQWILAGVLLAGGARTSPRRLVLSWATGGPRNRAGRLDRIYWRKVGAASLSASLFVLLLGPLTAPVRADRAAYRAQQALDREDYQSAGDELLSAIDLQRHNGFYSDGMALVYEESGLSVLAFKELDRGARLRPGNQNAAMNAARAALRIGRLDEGLAWLRLAASYGEFTGEVLTESAKHFVLLGRRYEAEQLLARFLKLGSTNRGAWQFAAEVYERLGESEEAVRLRNCLDSYQVDCLHGG